MGILHLALHLCFTITVYSASAQHLLHCTHVTIAEVLYYFDQQLRLDVFWLKVELLAVL